MKNWVIPKKNPNGEFLETPHWNFSFFYFTPGNLRQKKAQPLNIPQNCVRCLGNSKAKNKDPQEILHYFFLVTLGNLTRFWINPWKFYMLFLWYPWHGIMGDLIWKLAKILWDKMFSYICGEINNLYGAELKIYGVSS